MENRISAEGQLKIKGKNYNVGELVNALIYLPSDVVANFLTKLGLNVPRKLRVNSLKEVLKHQVDKTIHERKGLADELGYRLTFFEDYTETQLVNLLEFYKSPSLNQEYLLEFWTELLTYIIIDKKAASEDALAELAEEAKNYKKNGYLPYAYRFNDELNSFFFDEPEEIDGVTQDDFRYVTYKASTLTELKQISDKFNAQVPKRLKKNELLAYMMDVLKERGQLTDELAAKLKTYNVLILERYAKDNDIKISTELKKEEIIEYILSNAQETKETYVKPVKTSVYQEKQLSVKKDISLKPREEVVKEPEEVVKEQPKPAPVEEPKPVIREEVRVVQGEVDLTLVVEQLKEINRSIQEKVINVQQPVVIGAATAAPQESTDSKDDLYAPQHGDFKLSSRKAASHSIMGMPKGLLFTAGLLAIIISLVVMVSATLLLVFEESRQWVVLKDIYTFVDGLEYENLYILLPVIVLGIIGFVGGFRMFDLMSEDSSRKETTFWGFVFLINVFNIISAILAFIAASKRVKLREELVQDTIAKAVKEAKDAVYKRTFIGFIGMIIGWISFICVVVVVILMFEQTRDLPVLKEIYETLRNLLGLA